MMLQETNKKNCKMIFLQDLIKSCKRIILQFFLKGFYKIFYILQENLYY